jgi:hypothetical protein
VAFYMSTYIMDAICFLTLFPLMNWDWNITCPQPIQEYHSKPWEENAINSFYEICHFIIIPMHKMLYGCDPPHILETVSENLKEIVDWFIEESFSYMRVYGCSVPPHALPKFLADRLVLTEVAHQIVKGGSKEILANLPCVYREMFITKLGPFQGGSRITRRNKTGKY